MLKLKKLKGNYMLKKSLYILSCSAILSASTTMCYKENHLLPSTIEEVSLDGGKCDGKLSVLDMKNDGYTIESVKVQNSDDGLNYVYIFKKDDNKKVANIGLKDQLKLLRDEESEQKLTDEEKKDLAEGKKLYLADCVDCHGEKAELKAYNSSRPLISLSEDERVGAIRDYSLDTKDNGMAYIMKPYADSLMQADMKKISKYIDTLK
jgi:cytochrome c553